MSSDGVDFYLLEADSDAAIDRLACRVVEKAYAAGHRISLLARDPAHGEALDDLLWTYAQGSFIPHARAGTDGNSPVVIHAGVPPSPQVAGEVLVTLLDEPLPEAFHHLRIADMIGAGDARRQLARRRFRYYREHGMEPRTHRIQA